MKKLENKIALVTGGNSGIGLATAQLFREQGAQVIITARSTETFASAQKNFGHLFKVIQSDVSKVQEISALMSIIKAEFGRIDILFANAGISHIEPVADFDEVSFDLQFDTNVKGIFFTVQKAAPLLAPSASVIINASAAAGMGFAGGSVYGATKGALVSLTRHFAAEYSAQKIRFNSISPSLIDSPIQSKLGLDPAILKAIQESSRKNPAGRIGESSEVAQVVAFLASDLASYINGVNLLIDGGGSAVPMQF